MDLKKLKLDKFKNIKTVNFPEDIHLGFSQPDTGIEVIIYYIDKITDVEKFVSICHHTPLPVENRTIMIYKKGRKDGVNRDAIFIPFKAGKYPEFRLKAPMLCSLSADLSACVLCLDSS